MNTVELFPHYAEFSRGLVMMPLRVVCYLAAPVVTYDDLHLDAILSYAVVEEQTRGALLGTNREYMRIPLPLAEHWRSPAGVPLWSSTTFRTSFEVVEDTRYLHRRALESRMTTRSIQTRKGRHKERRTPMPTHQVLQLQAECLGNAEEIGRLLSSVTAIGKKRASGFGVVSRWQIDEIDSFSFIQDGQYARPTPFVALDPIPIGLPLQQAGFSPPYWHAQTRTACIPRGVEVT